LAGRCHGKLEFRQKFLAPCLDRPSPAGLLSRRMAFSYHAFLLAIPAMFFSPHDSSTRLDDCAANSQRRQPGGDGKFGSQWAKQALDSEPAVSIFWIWN